MDAERLRDFGAALARDAWDLLVEQLKPPFATLGSQLYWTHIAAALALATLVYALEGAASRRSLASAGRDRIRSVARAFWHESARVDYAYYFVNGVVYPLLVLPWLASDVTIRSGVRDRLVEFIGPRAASEGPGALTVIALSAVIFVAYDLGRWIGHFFQHKVPALWELHKVHHSAEVLTPITNFRVHPIDLAVMATSTTVTVGAAAGLIVYLFPGDAALFGELSLRAALALFALDLAGSLLRHTSVWLSYGPVIGRVLISPAQHQIHHSTDPRHAGKNMGFALALWDWMAGTLYITGSRESLTYGAGDGDDSAYRSVLRLYVMPFRGLLARLRARRSAAATLTTSRAVSSLPRSAHPGTPAAAEAGAPRERP